MRLAQQHRSGLSTGAVIAIVVICIVLFLGLIAVACAGFGLFAFKKVSEELEAAQAPVEAFFNQLQAGQLQAAYQSTTPDFQTKQTFAQFSAFVAANPNLTAHTSRETVGFNMNNVNGIKTSTLPYALTGPTGVTNCTVVVQDSGDGWKVHQLTVP